MAIHCHRNIPNPLVSQKYQTVPTLILGSKTPPHPFLEGNVCKNMSSDSHSFATPQLEMAAVNAIAPGSSKSAKSRSPAACSSLSSQGTLAGAWSVCGTEMVLKSRLATWLTYSNCFKFGQTIQNHLKPSGRFTAITMLWLQTSMGQILSPFPSTLYSHSSPCMWKYVTSPLSLVTRKSKNNNKNISIL